MFIQRLKYYLKTSSAQRAHDKLEYMSVLNQYSDAMADLDDAYSAITATVKNKAEAYDTCACVIKYTQPSPIAGALVGLPSAPITLSKKCCFLDSSDGTCVFAGCKNQYKNMRYARQREICKFWRNRLDNFWAQKYANVK